MHSNSKVSVDCESRSEVGGNCDWDYTSLEGETSYDWLRSIKMHWIRIESVPIGIHWGHVETMQIGTHQRRGESERKGMVAMRCDLIWSLGTRRGRMSLERLGSEARNLRRLLIPNEYLGLIPNEASLPSKMKATCWDRWHVGLHDNSRWLREGVPSY